MAKETGAEITWSKQVVSAPDGSGRLDVVLSALSDSIIVILDVIGGMRFDNLKSCTVYVH